MQTYERVTEVGRRTRIAYGYPYPQETDASRHVSLLVHGNTGNIQGDRRSPNPHKFTRTQYETTRGNYTEVWYQGQVPYRNQVIGIQNDSKQAFLFAEEPEWGRLVDSNWEKIYDKIRGQSNLIVDLAESSATIRMLRETTKLKTVMDGFFGRTRVPRRLKRWQERLDYLTGKWLEYRYGWMPCVYSIYDAMETLANKVVVDPNVWVRARSSYATEKSIAYGKGTIVEPRVTGKVEASYRCETKVNFELPAGLGLRDWTSLNPAGIAWELLPLSFVADWVVNVSQQLSLWENWWLYRSQFRTGYQTLSYKRQQKLSVSGTWSRPTLYGFEGVIENHHKSSTVNVANATLETHKDRTVLTSIPFPSGFRIEFDLGTKRQLDAAALLQQTVAKRLR